MQSGAVRGSGAALSAAAGMIRPVGWLRRDCREAGGQGTLSWDASPALLTSLVHLEVITFRMNNCEFESDTGKHALHDLGDIATHRVYSEIRQA